MKAASYLTRANGRDGYGYPQEKFQVSYSHLITEDSAYVSNPTKFD
jgi:hypothetical protein